MNKFFALFILAGFIAISCSNKKSSMKKNPDNPFFNAYQTPFEVPPFDKIKNEHYLEAYKVAIAEHEQEIEAIVNNKEKPNYENTITAFDNSGKLLHSVEMVFDNLTEANTNKEMQKIAEEVATLNSKHNDKINFNKKLFERIKTVYDNKARMNLNIEQINVLEKYYTDFVRGGAGLDDAQQKILSKINEELSQLSLKFGNNLLAENNNFKLVIEKKEDLKGLPQSLIDAGAEAAKAAGMEGKWIYTLHRPSIFPFLTYSEKRDLREKIYKGYINRGNNDNEYDNKKILSRILVLRFEKSRLLGFSNFAEYALERNMAKKPEAAFELMNKIWPAALTKAKQEIAEMQKIIDKEKGGFQLQAWDWWYYAEKVRKAKYDLDEEAIRPYFKLENVVNGVFEITNKLFGLQYAEIKDIPKPHADAVAYEVKNANGEHVAVLYMDFFPRESKRGGAWMDNYRKQYKENGKNVSPIITLVCNFSKPTGSTPALLNYDEVNTLFHEFGHGLHGMISNCVYLRLSATSVPRDFVELPSQIMENWAAEPEALKLFAKHYQTNQPIPDALIQKMQKTETFNKGFETVEFTAAALLDMYMHTTTDTNLFKDILKLENDIAQKIGLLPEIAFRYRSTYFSHITGGYAAGYYVYQWAEVLDADAFQAFKENGIFDVKTAKSFVDNILSKGGTDDAMEMYKRFRGAEPDITPMLKRRGLI